MATKRGNLSAYAYNELVGIVVGLDGDPANREGEAGTTMSSAYNFIEWNEKTEDRRAVLLWSRVVLCELMSPYDDYRTSRLAFVLRPRALWLYQKSATECADFVGNTSLYTEVGRVGHLTEITPVNPPYRRGDVIRVGTLPAPITMSTWDDNYIRTRMPYETYDGDYTNNRRTFTIPSPYIENVRILASEYDASYADFDIDEILYYDKNVDARTRIVGRTAATGDTIKLSLCVGGVMHIYEVTGRKIS